MFYTFDQYASALAALSTGTCDSVDRAKHTATINGYVFQLQALMNGYAVQGAILNQKLTDARAQLLNQEEGY
jgi:hypothetical protein